MKLTRIGSLLYKTALACAVCGTVTTTKTLPPVCSGCANVTYLAKVVNLT